MTTKLAETLRQIDQLIYQYAKQAIGNVGGDYKNLPLKMFKIAAEDHHLRVRSWLVTYQQQGEDTRQDSIGENPELVTEGNLRVTFALPGKGVKDVSRKPARQQMGDNLGVEALRTTEVIQQEEQGVCRDVASEFCELMQRYCNISNLMIKDYSITDNAQHTESTKLIWWPVTCEIEWELWWRKRGNA